MKDISKNIGQTKLFYNFNMNILFDYDLQDIILSNIFENGFNDIKFELIRYYESN